MSIHPEPSVLWREGMFLGPQHMQAFARELLARIARGDTHGRVGAYGLASISIDEEALERDVFSVQAAEILLRDGTLARIPTTAEILERDFSEHFDRGQLMVFLGLPAARENTPQIGDGPIDGEPHGARYTVQARAVFDENLRDSTLDLEFRVLRARLFFGDEERAGYECLPIARLVRQGKPVARSVLDPTYVPPILCTGASSVLSGWLGKLAERAREQARDLATRVPSTTLLSSIEKGADLEAFVKLQTVNRALATLEQVRALPDLAPLAAWQALVAAIGDLAVFGPERVAPELPVYDQDDLSGCFGEAVRILQELLIAEVSVPYDAQAFARDPERDGFFDCEIPREWAEAGAIFHLAVELARPAQEVEDLVSRGVKLISRAEIERVLQGVMPGIPLTFLRNPPVSFPKRPDLHFFRIETEGEGRDSWLQVVKARSAVILSALGAFGQVGYHLYVELPGKRS